MKEYQKQKNIYSVEQFNRLSEREKQNRGAVFSRAIIKAEKALDCDEMYKVYSRIYSGTGHVESGLGGDHCYLTKEAFEILESYYPDVVY